MQIAVAIATLGWLAGLLMGWYCRGTVGPPKKVDNNETTDRGLSFWDPHGCLNALNRCIFEQSSMELKDQPVYLVATHLQMLVTLSKSEGWIRPPQLHQWLAALLELHQYLHTVAKPLGYKVSLPDELVQLQVTPLGDALVSLLHSTGSVTQVTIECQRIRRNDFSGPANTQVLLRVSVTGIDAPTSPGWSVDVACEATLHARSPSSEPMVG